MSFQEIKTAEKEKNGVCMARRKRRREYLHVILERYIQIILILKTKNLKSQKENNRKI